MNAAPGNIASPLIDAGVVAALWNEGISWRLWLRMGRPTEIAIAILQGALR